MTPPTISQPSSSLLKQAFEHLSTAVFVFGADGEVLAINPGAEAMLELSDRQARGLTLERLFPPPNRCAELSEAALELLQPLRERQVEVPLVDGRVVNVDCTVTPMTELSGPGRFMIELVDLGEHLRVKREELLIAQNESTRTVLRGLAHEIRNPLGGLRGAAQLLERAFDDPAVSEYSSVIIAEADRLQNLLDRMLGPRQPPQRVAVNIHEVTERVCTLIHAEAGPGVSVVRDYDPSIPDLVGDYDMLIQALLNLARNAVQALEGQGTVLIRTRVERNSHVGSRRHRLVAQIDVIDDGPGIPTELQASLFYPMVTGRAEGTGLGLTIAQSLVAHHGGLIECISSPGQTQFSVLLPLAVGMANES